MFRVARSMSALLLWSCAWRTTAARTSRPASCDSRWPSPTRSCERFEACLHSRRSQDRCTMVLPSSRIFPSSVQQVIRFLLPRPMSRNIASVDQLNVQIVRVHSTRVANTQQRDCTSATSHTPRPHWSVTQKTSTAEQSQHSTDEARTLRIRSPRPPPSRCSSRAALCVRVCLFFSVAAWPQERGRADCNAGLLQSKACFHDASGSTAELPFRLIAAASPAWPIAEAAARENQSRPTQRAQSTETTRETQCAQSTRGR